MLRLEELQSKVKSFVVQNQLFNDTDNISLAVSGGADSMAMLWWFVVNTNCNLNVIHVNHGIRGRASREDAAFVLKECTNLGIDCTVYDAENDDDIIVPSCASEDWARQLRYGYFKKHAGKDWLIATAHTISDQAETFLFRAARGGSGLSGLSGIPVKRDNLVRPFLCLTRSEVMELIGLYGIQHINDETNDTDNYARNDIRHNVMPVLTKINPRAEEAIAKACGRAAKAQSYISKVANDVLTEASTENTNLFNVTNRLLCSDDVILDEIAIQLLDKINSVTEYNIKEVVRFLCNQNYNETTSQVASKRNGTINFSNGSRISVKDGMFIVQKSVVGDRVTPCLGDNVFGEHKYKIQISIVDALEINNVEKGAVGYLDGSKVQLERCILRTRENGDKFETHYWNTGKLVKHMADNGVHSLTRGVVPVLEYDGQIIWAYGVGACAEYKANRSSSKLIKLSWG